MQGVPGVADARERRLGRRALRRSAWSPALCGSCYRTGRQLSARSARRSASAVTSAWALRCFRGWGETGLRITTPQGTRDELVAATPAGVDMLKVTATLSLVDEVCEGRRQTDAAIAELDAVARLPPVSIVRFVSMAAAGAAALGVVFGATRIPELLLIAVAAGFGALLRRGLAKISHNLFVQPLAAALLAGVIGAVALRQTFSPMSSLVAVCPAWCWFRTASPERGGSISCADGIPLGMARIGYASVIIVMVCTGLLVGLALGGASLPIDEPSAATPLVFDALAAGIAVLAYGTFFNMTWTMLPIPVVIGCRPMRCAGP